MGDQSISTEFEEFAVNLSDLMSAHLAKRSRIDARKLKLFDLVYSGKSQKVNELSDEIHWSTLQINRYFKKQYGFPLKTLLTIVRCNENYKEIANNHISPSSYYTDQSHFIKEVKKITETTPKQLAKNKNERFLQLSFLKEK